MAVQDTSRFGLKTYSSGADFHPTREDFNERMELLDELAAVALQGTHSARPLAAIRGRFWWSTDLRELSWDTGTTWEEVAPLGASGGAQTLSIVDAGASVAGAEGTSRRAARADHVHAIPLASASSHGAMPSQDKALLNTASSNASGSSLMRRDSGGRTAVSAPTDATHATPRSYVDAQVGTRALSSHTHNASDINAGVLAAARLPLATSSTAGAMPADDKAKLDGATNLATANSLVQRNADGVHSTGTPSHPDHVAPMGYVDDATADIRSATWHPEPSTLVRRLSSGLFLVDPPTNSNNPVNLGYMQDNTMADYGHAGTSNLNNLLNPGYWHCDDALATSGRNYPVVGRGGALQVLHTGGGHRRQNYYQRNNNTMYTRGFNGSSWTSWSVAFT